MLSLLKILYCKPKFNQKDLDKRTKNIVKKYSHGNVYLQAGKYITQTMVDDEKTLILKYRFMKNVR